MADLSKELSPLKNSEDKDTKLFYETCSKILEQTEQKAKAYVDNLRGKDASIAELKQRDRRAFSVPAPRYFTTTYYLRILLAWWHHKARPTTIIVCWDPSYPQNYTRI